MFGLAARASTLSLAAVLWIATACQFDTAGTLGPDPGTGDETPATPAPPSDPGPGAGAVPAPEPSCPAECTRCDAGVCIIDCTTGDRCRGETVVCPDDMPCQVDCEEQGACDQGVLCGSQACQVRCRGDACDAGVDCSGSCSCSATCNSGGGCDELDFGCPQGCEQDGACVSGGSCDQCS